MKLSGYQVELTQVTSDDLEQLRNWRNDPQVNQFMISQQEITLDQQQAWFKKIRRDQGQQHFVIRYKGTPIGYANLKARGLGKSLTEATAVEPGLYIASEQYRNNILAFAPTLLLNDYCFDSLGVEKLLALVKESNIAALNYNEKLGYTVVERGDLVEIELTARNYKKHTEQLRALLSRVRKGN
jgi:RimJ/RimL family protein N-acetyltransferase